ncbi:hypothetical protein [Pontiella sulfatireligans]|uniref:Ig-like domain-containing protein n=1 Tax=Pontiella sulfatireligans TaxID=2750658 RepID=A0A6C2ULV0_9BACT|nr:hypothetical protein [Pontiella sulfatireligans]VGO21240.1 hypothetical protein SCARR_03312 [Pontiella sulfatireligans]
MTFLNKKIKGLSSWRIAIITTLFFAVGAEALSPHPPGPPPSPLVIGIEINGSLEIEKGSWTIYTCTASYTDGSRKEVSPAWSISSPSSSTSLLDSGWLYTGLIDVGQTITLTAVFGGMAAELEADIKNVPPVPVLVGLEIAGPTNVNRNAWQEYTCTAAYSDGSRKTVTPSWSLASPAFSSSITPYNASGWLNTGLTDFGETVTLKAAFKGMAGELGATVKNVPWTPALTGLEINGPTLLNEDIWQAYTCTATYSDGTQKAVDPSWGLSSPSSSMTLYPYSHAGWLYTGLIDSDQTATLTAFFEGMAIEFEASIKNVPSEPVLTGVKINGPLEIEKGSWTVYTCTASYTDGSRKEVSPAWSISSPSSSSLIDSGWLYAGLIDAGQTITLTATFGGLADELEATISSGPAAPALIGLEIAGPTNVNRNAWQEYTCTAAYSDGSRKAVTPSWSLASPAFSSTITPYNASGWLNTGLTDIGQTLTLRAAFAGMAGELRATIKIIPPAPALSGLEINGPTQLNEDVWQAYTCTATYSDGTQKAVDPSWGLSSPSSSMTLYPYGHEGWLYTGLIDSDQTVTLSAFFEGAAVELEASIKNVPSEPVLTGVKINGPAEVQKGSWTIYSCTASYSDGSQRAVQPSWSISSPSSSSLIDSGWLYTGLINVGQTITLAASFGGRTAELEAAITSVPTDPVLTGLEIAGPTNVNQDEWQEYTCTASYSDGSRKAVTPSWTLASPAFSSSITPYNASGWLHTGLTDIGETVTLRAAFEGMAGELRATIKTVPPAPALSGLEINGPTQLNEDVWQAYTCTATYSDGTQKAVDPSWGLSSPSSSMTLYPYNHAGWLYTGLIDSDQTATLTAFFEGMAIELVAIIKNVPSAPALTALETAGTTNDKTVTVHSLDEIIFPLTGFEGQWLDCYLYDETADEYISFGHMYEPDELVIQNLDPTHLYWLRIRILDEKTGQWPLIHDSSIEYIKPE